MSNGYHLGYDAIAFGAGKALWAGSRSSSKFAWLVQGALQIQNVVICSVKNAFINNSYNHHQTIL